MIEERFEQIPRRAYLSQEEFEQDFLLERKPVILTNLFQDQPIQKLANIESVRRQLGEIPLMVSEGIRHYHLAQTNASFEPARSLMLGDYLDFIDQEPETALLCSENALPDEIQMLFTIPKYCQFGDRDDLTTRLFLGNAGNYAHLHFDGDFRQVLFYQVCGSKRIVIIPANAAPKLVPNQHWSMVCLEHLSEAEKDAFIAYAGGVQCILNPGEALFFPAAAWHYVEYLTTGMSIAIRFGRNRYTRFLGEKCHLDSKLQRIASQMIDEQTVQEQYSKEYEVIQQAFYQPAQSVREKVRQMSTAYDHVWKVIAEPVESIYQISIPDQLAQTTLEIQAQRRYGNIIQPIPQFGGWGWASAN
ncbi:cupin-like domain-containing protein [Nostoc sp. UHCC 0251]|uniref:cupin-like domain-containing protein n=1 Tax=Nostoc sp. UHCC 0251 TaxID=3110240 RepID=UPI002B209DD7|nr:cupin-like domain-containing protein [Nostoc sp. UHCC 0251]MEA5627195.1 cupin-like domain-containing protein [Nostoc sp. UHCC 0251]